MSLRAQSSARPASTAATASLVRVRRGSLAALVLLVVQYGIGMYVNLYVTVPRDDHGSGLGSAIANGPAMLSSHAVLGLLLGLVAIAVVVHAVMARHLGAIVSSALGLLALVSASAAGASFTSSGGWPRRYEGPVQTAMRNHIDHIHAEDDVAVEIREPG
jgi:hypothetical protein